MSETPLPPQLTGKMFLYETPELLTRDAHANLGLSPVAEPFTFCRSARALPLTAREFAVAQRFYPIIFTGGDQPTPLAVTGLKEDSNLFVDASGQWERGAYIPGYVRRYPLAFAGDPQGDRLAVVIDRSSPMVKSDAQMPFFDGEDLSESTQQAVEFCRGYEQDKLATLEFVKKLQDLDLLTTQEARFKPDGADDERALASYVAVEEKRLRELSSEKFMELRDSNVLPLVYAHLFSMGNWRPLMERANAAAAPANVA